MFNIIPRLATPMPWYQMLIKVTRERRPFVVTFSAEMSWDIDGQYDTFRVHYEKDPTASQLLHSKFRTEAVELGMQTMAVDLHHNTVVNVSTDEEFPLKRRDSLLGTLIAFGRIEFQYQYKGTKRVFVYDQMTGYDRKTSGEAALKIGDRVIFEVWW